MNIVIGLLTAVLVVVSILLVFIVLMQRPKQEGLGASFGGGVTDQMFGAQTTNVLQKFTVYLAVMFFVITLLMQFLVAKRQNQTADLGKNLAPAAKEEPTAPAANPDGSISTTPIITPVDPATLDTDAIIKQIEADNADADADAAPADATPGEEVAPNEEAAPAADDAVDPAPATEEEVPTADGGN
jgi:preprotein translocase subunit SecG